MERIQSAHNMKTNRKYAVGKSITIHGIANPAANPYKISKIYFSRNKRFILMKGRHYGSSLPTVRIVGEVKDVKIKHEKVKYKKGKTA